jgi:hypothetical protein
MLIFQTVIIKQNLTLLIFFQHNEPTEIVAVLVVVSVGINPAMSLQLQGVSRSLRISMSRSMHPLQWLSLLLPQQPLWILLISAGIYTVNETRKIDHS